MFIEMFLACLCLVIQDEPASSPTDAQAVIESSDSKEKISPELSKKVDELVRQLDADSLLDRNQAEKALIDLGPDIINLLKPGSGEAGQRIDRIRNTLERQLIETTTQATRVTLAGKMTVADALAEISKQTGNKFIGAENRDQELDLELLELPFWEAVDTVLDNAKLTIDDYGGDGLAVQIVTRSDFATDRLGQVDYEGIFRISPARISLAKNLENPAFDAFRVTIRVAWEPRLQPISINVPLSELTVKDEIGDEIEPLRAEGTVGTSINKQPSVEITLPISMPSPEAESISISGEITAVVPGRIETFEFVDLKNPRKQKIERGQAVVTFEGLEKNHDLHAAKIRVRFENSANSLESHRGWIYSNEAYLIDATGRRIEAIGLEMYRQTEQDIGLAYLFDLQEIPDGLKLVYRSPAAIVSLPVKFEISKLKLP
jgi:hypothetical protein